MANEYAQIAFTENVRKKQQELGSRDFYARFDEGEKSNNLLGDREIGFLAERDSFYLATVSETGWPYVQHRGGPKGFIRVLNEGTIAFSDFRGNRQFLSVSNIESNDKVSLFFMDYPNKQRLKILGRMKEVDIGDNSMLGDSGVEGYRAKVDRVLQIAVQAFDWNCPQHITPRYTSEEFEEIDKTPEPA